MFEIDYIPCQKRMEPIMSQFLGKDFREEYGWSKAQRIWAVLTGQTLSISGQKGRDTEDKGQRTEIRIRSQTRTQVSPFREEGFGYPRVVMSMKEYFSKKGCFDFVSSYVWDHFQDKDCFLVFPEKLVTGYHAVLQDSKGDWWYRDSKTDWEEALPANQFVLPKSSLKGGLPWISLCTEENIKERRAWLEKLRSITKLTLNSPQRLRNQLY